MPASGIATVLVDLKSQFLDGLASGDRKTILATAKQRRFLAHSVMTTQGHPADNFFLLITGLARYFFITGEGKKLLFRWIGPGDLIGGRTVLSGPSSYLVSTETVTESTALVWDRSTIRGLIARYPRLLENALLTASDYLDWHVTSHVGLACHTARERVAQVLGTLARTIGQKAPQGVAISITNEDLANAANVTHFTASRLMSEWQRERVLVKRRGKILLRSPERLLLRVV
jgi:CRP-like cAMP-binding protein